MSPSLGQQHHPCHHWTKLVGLGQDGINAHRRGIQASHHVLGVGHDLVDIPGILAEFLNDVGILRQSVGERLRIIDGICQWAARILHEAFQLTEHRICAGSNILRGCEKIVD